MATGRTVWVSISGRANRCVSYKTFALPVGFLLIGYQASFSRGKRPEHDADHLTACSTPYRNTFAFISSPPTDKET